MVDCQVPKDFGCLVLLLLFMSGMCGCRSDSELERIPLSGTVLRQNEPLATGTLSLIPVGDSAPAANTAITDGEYEFTDDNGPVAGNYQALISVVLTKAELMQASATKGGRRRVRPPKSKWEFDVIVPLEEPYVKDFTLQE